MNNQKLAALLIRIGIAFVFAYAAVAATLAPENWIGYFPQFMKNIVPGNILLPFFSFYETILAVWLLSGKKMYYASLLSALSMAGIIITNLSLIDVTFRDVSILFSSLALAFMEKDKK